MRIAASASLIVGGGVAFGVYEAEPRGSHINVRISSSLIPF